MFKTYLGAGMQAGSGAIASPSGGHGGPGAGPGGWEPSVLYMAVLVIAEIIAVAFLSRHLLGG